jgi:hypothetical protein
MRRLFLLALAIALLSGGVVYAANDYALPNATVFGASGGPTGVSPATQIIKVRYARMEANAPSLASGDVVSWDEISADGITISGCVFDSASSYAGILVTGVTWQFKDIV